MGDFAKPCHGLMHFNKGSNKKIGQIIETVTLDGPSQMAADVMMLEELTKNANLSIAVRFYKWQGSWLSIGQNQKRLPNHWIDLVKKKQLNIVRRPSGGSSVLHAGGITYALAWRTPPTKRRQAYKEASQWLIKCFLDLGLSLEFGTEKQDLTCANCFASSTSSDLIDAKGIKRIGSAQLWRKGNLLQHGEILLDPPKELWRKIFETDPPETLQFKTSKFNIETSLKESLISSWSELNWLRKELNNKDLKAISKNSNNYLLDLSESDS